MEVHYLLTNDPSKYFFSSGEQMSAISYHFTLALILLFFALWIFRSCTRYLEVRKIDRFFKNRNVMCVSVSPKTASTLTKQQLLKFLKRIDKLEPVQTGRVPLPASIRRESIKARLFFPVATSSTPQATPEPPSSPSHDFVPSPVSGQTSSAPIPSPPQTLVPAIDPCVLIVFSILAKSDSSKVTVFPFLGVKGSVIQSLLAASRNLKTTSVRMGQKIGLTSRIDTSARYGVNKTQNKPGLIVPGLQYAPLISSPRQNKSTNTILPPQSPSNINNNNNNNNKIPIPVSPPIMSSEIELGSISPHDRIDADPDSSPPDSVDPGSSSLPPSPRSGNRMRRNAPFSEASPESPFSGGDGATTDGPDGPEGPKRPQPRPPAGPPPPSSHRSHRPPPDVYGPATHPETSPIMFPSMYTLDPIQVENTSYQGLELNQTGVLSRLKIPLTWLDKLTHARFRSLQGGVNNRNAGDIIWPIVLVVVGTIGDCIVSEVLIFDYGAKYNDIMRYNNNWYHKNDQKVVQEILGEQQNKIQQQQFNTTNDDPLSTSNQQNTSTATTSTAIIPSSSPLSQQTSSVALLNDHESNPLYHKLLQSGRLLNNLYLDLYESRRQVFTIIDTHLFVQTPTWYTYLALLPTYGLWDSDDTECNICCTQPKRVIILPCRHISTCATCTQQIQRCPLCRATINSTCVYIAPPPSMKLKNSIIPLDTLDSLLNEPINTTQTSVQYDNGNTTSGGGNHFLSQEEILEHQRRVAGTGLFSSTYEPTATLQPISPPMTMPPPPMPAIPIGSHTSLRAARGGSRRREGHSSRQSSRHPPTQNETTTTTGLGTSVTSVGDTSRQNTTTSSPAATTSTGQHSDGSSSSASSAAAPPTAQNSDDNNNDRQNILHPVSLDDVTPQVSNSDDPNENMTLLGGRGGGGDNGHGTTTTTTTTTTITNNIPTTSTGSPLHSQSTITTSSTNNLLNDDDLMVLSSHPTISELPTDTVVLSPEPSSSLSTD